jgi:hypothetical protein
MPYMRVDQDAYDEWASELGPDELGPRPSGGFEYETAETKFDRAKLPPVPRMLLDALIAAGATAFKVRYDGGYDEGFSHPEALVFGSGEVDAMEAIRKLATPDLISAIRAAAGSESVWGNASDLYNKSSDQKVMEYALDELAHHLACRLLGDSFGTGEYQLYGAFTADFKTGEITDHENAEKPAEME